MMSKRSDPAGAMANLERAIDMAEQHGLQFTRVRCLLERGRIEALQGDRDAARASFEQARDLSERIGARFTADAVKELIALSAS